MAGDSFEFREKIQALGPGIPSARSQTTSFETDPLAFF